MRAMRFSILLLWMSLLLSSPGRVWAQRGNETVIIKGYIVVEGSEGFSFDHLSVFTQYRKDTSGPWIVLGSKSPDSKGRFTLEVPLDSRIFVEVTTSDPTVIQAFTSRPNADFYVMRIGERKTVYFDDFIVPIDAKPVFDKTIRLRIGAAIKVCLPPKMDKGSIVFYELAENTPPRTNYFAFADSSRLNTVFMAGLEPTDWRISLDEMEDRVVDTQVIKLKRGEVNKVFCY